MIARVIRPVFLLSVFQATVASGQIERGMESAFHDVQGSLDQFRCHSDVVTDATNLRQLYQSVNVVRVSVDNGLHNTLT